MEDSVKLRKLFQLRVGRKGGKKLLSDPNLGGEVMVNSMLMHCKEISS